jgi:RHS repeat-associated protein
VFRAQFVEFQLQSHGGQLVESRSNKDSATINFKVTYTYNLDGSLKTLTYPSGDVLTYTPGGAGRATQLSDSANSYVGYTGNFATYAPNGSLAGMTNGHTSSFAGIVTKNTYNDRLQPILHSAGVPSQAQLLSLCYDFHLGVAVTSAPCTFPAYTTGDNGNVQQIINFVDSTRSATFAYDNLNRIQQANSITTTGINCWGETYIIDAWGNLTNRGGVSGMTGCATEGLSSTASTKNQLSILSYDLSGNVTNDGGTNHPTYDVENRIAIDASVTYAYDANGTRIKKSSGSMYWTGAGGEFLTEATLAGTINEEYIYFNGARIARVDRPSGVVHYYFSDHLGSASVITDALGNVTKRDFYFPYGGEQASSTGSDPNHYKFAGKERDAESGLDYFGARYYASNMGRMMSPDWSAKVAPIPYAKLGDPQSLNLYAYVGNNPLSRFDPDGHVGKCEGDTAQCGADLAKLAPGTKAGADGTVIKAGLLQRIWNHLDGNGAGTSLVSSIVNTSTVVHISTDPGSRNGSTEGDAGNVFIRYDPTGSTNQTRTGPGNSAIAAVDKPGQVTLGHELIHATHIANGTIDFGFGVHAFSDPNGNFQERWRTEEFRTVGFQGFTQPGDITEQQLRHQFGLNDRATYTNPDNWVPQP